MGEDRKQQIQNFLNAISQIESSGGKNFNHKEIESGMHQGHRAIGTYGLMPNTVKEMDNRMRRDGLTLEDAQAIQEMAPDAMKEYIESNPEYEKRLAEYMAGHVLDKQMGDEEKAAYSWFQGHNMSPESIDSQGYKDHDYVKKYNKFNKLKSILGKEQ